LNFVKQAMIAITLILLSVTAFAAVTPNIEGVPDKTIAMSSGPLEKFVDLRNYASDDYQNAGDLFYKIQSESNVHLIDCFIEDDYFVSCNAPKQGVIGTNKITVKVINGQGISDTDEFNLKVYHADVPEEVIFEVDRSRVSIEPRDSINVVLTIENTYPEKKCFDLDVNLDHEERDDISANPAKDSFCLNANEKTSFSMTITSFEGARVDDYDIDLYLDYDTGSEELTVNVEVIDSEDPLDIFRATDYFVCREPYTQEIGIRLENNSSRYQTINLRASHELLMPQFEYTTTRLASGDYDEMALRIHTNYTTALTEYLIPVFARSENYFVERDIKIRLIECEEDAFDLTVTPEERVMEREEREFFTVILQSNSDEGQEVRLSSISDLPTELDSYNVYLPANAEVRLKLEVRARETDNDGTHAIEVNAWNSKETERENVRVRIESQHKIEMIIENNDFDARICSATEGQVFEARIINKGDYDETVELTLAHVHESIQAVLSEDEIDIEVGGEKIVYVFINPSFGTPLGDYRLTLIAETNRDELREELRFRVIEGDIYAIENVIELSSVPREIVLAPGEEKTFSFTIENPTGIRMENVRIRFFGASEGVTVFPMDLGDLGAFESTTVTRTIKARENVNNKVYNATIEVRADGYVTTQNTRIRVTNEAFEEDENGDESQENSILAGFAVLSGSEIMLGGVIILILLIAILIVLSLLNSNESKEVDFYTENENVVQ